MFDAGSFDRVSHSVRSFEFENGAKMSVNPFGSLWPSNFGENFNYAIQSVIDLNQRTCRLSFDNELTEACPDCADNNSTPIGARGPNPFLNGGNGSYPSPICPTCKGSGVRQKKVTADIQLALIWDYRSFMNIAGVTKWPEGAIQSICNKSYTADIKKCTSMQANIDIQPYSDHTFFLNGEPTPIGLDNDEFIICLWTKE